MNTQKPNLAYLLTLFLALTFTVQHLSAGLTSSTEGLSTGNFIALTVDSPVQCNITESSSTIEMSVNFSDAININDVQETHQLPVLARWIRISERGNPELEFSAVNTRRISGEAPVIDGNHTGIYPPESVVMSQPMIMRGIRVVKLTLYPVRWDYASEEYVISQGLNVNIKNVGGQGVNEVESLDRQPSQGFDRMIDALLVNPPRRDDPVNYLPGGYLLVADDNYPDVINEFADWKFASGHPVQILTFDPGATDEVQLKEMIQDVYREFNFEYLVLFGNENADTPCRIPFNTDAYYDIFFAQLEGDDPLADVTVGSFNCMDEDNLTCAVRRAISYQYEPYTDDLDWYTIAGVAAGECSVPNDMSPSYTTKWVTEVLSRKGFDVTGSYFVDNRVNDPTPMVRDLYNNRCNFILVRAHQNDFDADEIEATGVYPFHFLVSSSTLTGAFNRAFRMGTPDDMRGPSAGFGHNGSPRTNVANAIAGGFIESTFLFKIGCYGWARNYTIANLARVMPADDDDYRYGYYSSWRYYGDPGQDCWVGVPRQLTVSHPQSFDPDQTIFSVNVINADNERPISGAVVCISQVDGIQFVRQTNAEGNAQFTFESGDLNENELNIMVTGDGLLPNRQTIESEDVDILFVTEEIVLNDEEGGNGDGIASPGETLTVSMSLFNRGAREYRNDMVNPDRIELFSLSPWAEANGEVRMPNAINQNGSFEIEDGFSLQILEGCPNDEIIDINVWVGSEVNAGLESGLSIDIEAPSLEFEDIEFINNLEPGSDTEFSVFLTNKGHVNTEELEARLMSMSPFISVTNAAAAYAPIEIDDIIENEIPFRVEADENTIPGSMAEFMLILEGDPGVIDTVYFSLPVGEAVEGDPLGPDKYGYIALDDDDEDIEWSRAPDYEWLDINHYNGEIQGDLLELGVHEEEDYSVLVDLPFDFTYYGEDYRQITVCSNGWIAMGDQTELVNQQNWVMPGFDGAFGMIAIFWDRLYMETRSDGVFTYHDADNGRFCIMWETGVHVDDEWQPNIFEAMLYDPEQRETPTGDSQILMQYNTVNNNQDEWEANASCTVGISSPEGLDGLTYTYWGDYPAQCAPLEGRRAILWTTVAYEWETGSLSGNVTRYIDSTAVAGASVRTSNGFETVTDENGDYELLGVTAGTFDLTVAAEGYGGLTEEDIELEVDAELEYNFVLPHSWMEFDKDSLYNWIGDDVIESDRLTISNIGNLDLDFSITIDSDYEIYIEPEEGSIESGNNQVISFDIENFILRPGHYEYELVINNSSPEHTVVVLFIIDILSVDEEELTIPTVFSLSEPYPNPFNSSTTIRFGLPKDSDVSVQLFDLTGRRITTLTEGRYKAGWHDALVDASGLATGIYFVRMEAGDFKSIKRLLLVK
ncbi:carboxypeptidase regulatory-like domain-containing protein [bacterium]|nr:carboxypeptidase regulatory-like domain-containing protein [bacterium]